MNFIIKLKRKNQENKGSIGCQGMCLLVGGATPCVLVTIIVMDYPVPTNYCFYVDCMSFQSVCAWPSTACEGSVVSWR